MADTTTGAQVDQEYVACKPTPSMPGDRHIRIRVLHGGPFNGEDKVLVATVRYDRDGRIFLDRRRMISARQLHADPKRRTGYRLAQNADGTPAAGPTS